MDTGIINDNPFIGLRAFEEDEGYLFFGRKTEINDLLKKFSASRFLAVIGSSGSGKSSLVKSGLLPAIHSGSLSSGHDWHVATLRPEGQPLSNLAKALTEKGVLYKKPNIDQNLTYKPLVESTLRRSTNGLMQAYKQSPLFNKSKTEQNDNLLILVDQFEELFRYSNPDRDPAEVASEKLHFVNLLLAASQQTELPIYVLITMRSDFLGDCAQFPGLPEAINEGQYLVPRMTRDQMKESIEGPIAVGGANVDGGAKATPRLLTRLLNDVGIDIDQLPILQHAMMRTWQRWRERIKTPEENNTDANAKQESRDIDIVDYEGIGAMKDALSIHANEIYDELNDKTKQEYCRLIFTALTDKAADARGTRRPRKVSELFELTDTPVENIKEIAEAFRKPGRTFLMPLTGAIDKDTTLDISHESLMRVWDKLKEWANDEAQDAQIFKRLAERASLEGASYYTGPDLENALKLKEKFKNAALIELWAKPFFKDADATKNALEFLEKSKTEDILAKEKEKKLIEDAKAKEEELAAAKRKAIEEEKERQRQKVEEEKERQRQKAEEAKERQRQKAEEEKERQRQKVEEEKERQRQKAEEKRQRDEEEKERQRIAEEDQKEQSRKDEEGKKKRQRMFWAILVLLAFGCLTTYLAFDAKKQEGIANTSAEEAMKQEGIAKTSATEAKKQEDIAKAAASEAKKQEDIAKAAESEAKKQEGKAKAAESEAKKQEGKAKAAESEAKAEKAKADALAKQSAAAQYQKLIRNFTTNEDVFKTDIDTSYKLVAFCNHLDTLKNLGVKEAELIDYETYDKLYFCLKSKGNQYCPLQTATEKDNMFATDTVTNIKDFISDDALRAKNIVAITTNDAGDIIYSTKDNNLYVHKKNGREALKIAMGKQVTAIAYSTDKSIIYYGMADGEIGYIRYKIDGKNQPIYRNNLGSKITAGQFFTKDSNNYFLTTGKSGNAVIYKLGDVESYQKNSLVPNKFLKGIELPEHYGVISNAKYNDAKDAIVLVTAKGTYLWNPFAEQLLKNLKEVRISNGSGTLNDKALEIRKECKFY